MTAPHHSRRGSMGFSPRKRARSEVPHIKSWPEIDGSPRLQGFAGYKAGMTHAMIVDYRKQSTTANKLVRIPISVVEVPPMMVFSVRFYEDSVYGPNALTEIWADKLDPRLANRFPLPKDKQTISEKWKSFEEAHDVDEIDDVRVLVHTQPASIKAIPKKTPDVMEVRIGGGTIPERIQYARNILGKSISVTRFAENGDMIDVLAVTKGKGFQGPVKRWGVKLLTHKNSKHRRLAGNLGPFTPGYVKSTVPQAGQTGYHQRTEFNKRIVKVVRVKDAIRSSLETSRDSKKLEEQFADPDIGDDNWKGDDVYIWKTAEGDEKYYIWKDNPQKRLNDIRTQSKEGQRKGRTKKQKPEIKPMDDGITPKGGFLNYGVISSDYILLHGSIPGPTNRLIRLRNPVRGQFTESLKEPPRLVFISRESKQGV